MVGLSEFSSLGFSGRRIGHSDWQAADLGLSACRSRFLQTQHFGQQSFGLARLPISGRPGFRTCLEFRFDSSESQSVGHRESARTVLAWGDALRTSSCGLCRPRWFLIPISMPHRVAPPSRQTVWQLVGGHFEQHLEPWAGTFPGEFPGSHLGLGQCTCRACMPALQSRLWCQRSPSSNVACSTKTEGQLVPVVVAPHLERVLGQAGWRFFCWRAGCLSSSCISTCWTISGCRSFGTGKNSQ